MSGSVNGCGNGLFSVWDCETCREGSNGGRVSTRQQGGWVVFQATGDWENLGVEPKEGRARDSKNALFVMFPSSLSPTGIYLLYTSVNGQCFSKFIQTV